MTREEFLSFLNEELDERKREYKFAQLRIELYEKIIPAEDDLNMARFLALSAKQRLDDITSLIKAPAIARIQGSSDAEVEEFREQMRKELLEEVNMHERTINRLESEKKEREQNKEKFISKWLLSDDESKKQHRNAFEEIGADMIGELDEIDKQIGIYSFERQIASDTLQSINRMTIDEFKNELVKAQSNLKDRRRKNALDERPIFTDDVRLLASVAFDYEKSKKMLELLAEYKRLTTMKKQTHESIDIGPVEYQWNLLDAIKKSKSVDKLRGTDKLAIYNVNGLRYALKNYKDDFDEKVKIFKQHFTEEKLEPLKKPWQQWENVWYRDFEYTMDDDIKFIVDQHSDKIAEEVLTGLQGKLNRYKKLKRKIIKTEGTKIEMRGLFDSIKSDYHECLGKLFEWYSEKTKKIWPITPYDFNEARYWDVIYSVTSGHSEEKIKEIYKAINYLNDELDRIGEHLNVRKESFTPSIRFVEKQIRDLAGPEFANTDLTSLRNTDVKPEKILSNAIARQYEEEIANKINTAVRESADESESKITGKTIEELMEERRKLLKRQIEREDAEIAVTREEGERQKELANERKDAPVNKYGISYTDLGYRLVKSPEIKEEDIKFKNNPANVSYETEVSDKIQDIIDEIKDDPIIRKRKM